MNRGLVIAAACAVVQIFSSAAAAQDAPGPAARSSEVIQRATSDPASVEAQRAFVEALDAAKLRLDPNAAQIEADFRSAEAALERARQRFMDLQNRALADPEVTAADTHYRGAVRSRIGELDPEVLAWIDKAAE